MTLSSKLPLLRAFLVRYIELCDKATPGPWHQSTNGQTKGSGLEPAFPGVHDASGKPDGEDFICQALGNSEECYAHSAFIALSRTVSPIMARGMVESLDGFNEIRQSIHSSVHAIASAARRLDSILDLFPDELLTRV